MSDPTKFAARNWPAMTRARDALDIWCGEHLRSEIITIRVTPNELAAIERTAARFETTSEGLILDIVFDDRDVNEELGTRSP